MVLGLEPEPPADFESKRNQKNRYIFQKFSLFFKLSEQGTFDPEAVFNYHVWIKGYGFVNVKNPYCYELIYNSNVKI